ncbi:V/A-type H+-transporting ATPase subunit K [Methanomicrobium sp. W14]|uniref:ATPase n=1 Tax=Methanomicrobium sp. W14 TaxID=2817839 RepID=UPI001AE6C68F|nr:ATPase [Methanomicrobium sp. W14]MBP2133589.1 V/A-type H+-transporting ATPase subunit K [Methanomicrobium sp. W14]
MVVEGMTVEVAQASAVGFKAIGAGLAVGLAGMGTGLAQLGIGGAAVGATAENKEMFGLALLFTVIPETVVIFGLVVALLLLFT